MAGGTKTISVAPESDLARALGESGNGPIVVSVGGKRYQVAAEEISQGDMTDEELWADFDPARFLEGIDAAAGGWRHLDTERMKADIRRWREEGCRPMDRSM